MMLSDADTSIYQRRQDRLDAQQAAADAAAATPSTPPATQTPVETPGPAQEPQGGQNGNPPPAPSPAPPPQAAPPAIASAVEGIQGSKDTGGVQGSFQQAGTKGFSQKFGGDAPAVWFRNLARGGQTAPGASKIFAGDRGATTRGGASAGGAIPSVSSLPQGPEAGSTGGGPQDEEWQRFMQAVLAQRFGRG